MARLYLSVGEWGRARRRLTTLAAAYPTDALVAASLVAGLVRFDADTKEARKYLAALEKLQPGAARTVITPPLCATRRPTGCSSFSLHGSSRWESTSGSSSASFMPSGSPSSASRSVVP